MQEVIFLSKTYGGYYRYLILVYYPPINYYESISFSFLWLKIVAF